MVDYSLPQSNGSGGGNRLWIDEGGDDEFEMRLELEVRLDAQTDDPQAYAETFRQMIRPRLEAWLHEALSTQDEWWSGASELEFDSQHELSVELLEARAGSVIMRIGIRLKAVGKAVVQVVNVLAAAVTLMGAAADRLPDSDREKAAAGFEVVVIEQCEALGETLTGKKPQVTSVGPSDTKPLIKS